MAVNHKVRWVGGSAPFTTAMDWSTGAVPGSADQVTIDGGVLVSSNADETVLTLSVGLSTTFDINSGTFTMLQGTGTGAITGDVFVNNAALAASGTLHNIDLIVLDSSNFTALGAGVTLTGNGLFLLEDTSTVTGNLTNNGNDVASFGTATFSGGRLINGAAGKIETISSGTINIDDVSVANRGVIAAGASGTVAFTHAVDNFGGTISAADTGATVRLAGVSGGIVFGASDGSLLLGGTIDSSVHAVTLAGLTQIDVNDSATFKGTTGFADSNAVLQLNAGSDDADLIVSAAGATFKGHGTITGGSAQHDIITGDGTGTSIFTNVDNTISGAMTIGGGGLELINQKGGTILADTTDPLVINTEDHAVMNAGVLTNEFNGELYIAGAVVNTGTIDANWGNLFIGGAVTGTGVAIIESRGALEYGAAASIKTTFTLAGGSLTLDDPFHFTGKLGGFVLGDTLDLGGIPIGDAPTATFTGNAAGGTLKINDNAHIASIALTGDDYLTSHFSLSDDGFGGVTVNILGQNLVGTAADNTFVAGIGADTFDGLGNGTKGDTVSYANSIVGVQADLLNSLYNGGDAQGDVLANIENLTGSSHDDFLSGDAGNNILNGGAGNDQLEGGDGNDTLIGGSGHNGVSYDQSAAGVVVNLGITTAQNTVGAGIDTLSGITDLDGSSHNDILTGNGGNNAITGEQGDDLIEGGAGNDYLDGGTGGESSGDTVSYAHATAGVTVSLAIHSAQNTHGAGTDTVLDFENLTGSKFADKLIGDGGDNVITGGLGADNLTGGGGVNTFAYLAVKEGGDTITDFVSGADKIGILQTGFAIAPTDSTDFADHYFVSGAATSAHAPAATEAHGQFLFNTTSSQLFFDDDGTGAHVAVLIDTLSNHATLHASDFLLS